MPDFDSPAGSEPESRIHGPRPIVDDSWVTTDVAIYRGPDPVRPPARGRRRELAIVVAVVIAVLALVSTIALQRRAVTASGAPEVSMSATVEPTEPAGVAAATSKPAASVTPQRSGLTSSPAPGPPSPATATTPAIEVRTTVVVASSGRCLDDNNNRVAEANPVKVFSCNGTSAQSWTFGADATIRVHDLCLHPEAATPAAGALLAIYACGASAYETWPAGPNGSLVNAGSHLCLTEPLVGASSDRVSLETCDGGPRQRWT